MINSHPSFVFVLEQDGLTLGLFFETREAVFYAGQKNAAIKEDNKKNADEGYEAMPSSLATVMVVPVEKIGLLCADRSYVEDCLSTDEIPSGIYEAIGDLLFAK